MKKVTLLLMSISLFFLIFSPQVKATDGCCTGQIAGSPAIYCIAAATCGSSVMSCDTAANKADRDVNGDGSVDAEDAYNSSCYVPIVAPEQIRITDFGKLFSGAVAFILLIAFILAFIFLLLGAISWITSGGDKAGVEAARNKIINAIIGLIVVASVWAIFQLIGGAIGFNILGGFTIPRLF